MDDRGRILVVDDDPKNLILLQNMLESLGHESVLAHDGHECVEKLKPDIDLVLLDIMMSGMDGFEVAHRIRADDQFKELPIIMITVLNSKKDRLRAVEAGANDFISKPVDRLELGVRVTSLLKTKRAQDLIKESLREKEVLLQEIHHRVKNNLSVVKSLVRLQSRHCKDEFHRGMFLDTQDRIGSIALVHDLLYQSENMAHVNLRQYITSLVDQLATVCTVVGQNIVIEKNIDDVTFELDIAIPTGLIVNELVTNSMKHAFPDMKEGKVTISLLSNRDSMFELTVKDNGVGLPEGINLENSQSFGLNLVKMFSEQLNGEAMLLRDNGTVATIRFKAEPSTR
jgi:two-component sensor histidine kinase